MKLFGGMSRATEPRKHVPRGFQKSGFHLYITAIAHSHSHSAVARLAQLGERRSAEREAVGSNPGRTNTQGL